MRESVARECSRAPRPRSLPRRRCRLLGATPHRATTSRARSALAPGTSPFAKPAIRKTLASPCHSAVGLEQLRGLVRALRPAAAERGHELDEREVGDEAGVVAPEALEGDDAHAPRADAPLASQPRQSCRGRKLQRLEVDRPRHSRERRRTTCGQSAANARQARAAPALPATADPRRQSAALPARSRVRGSPGSAARIWRGASRARRWPSAGAGARGAREPTARGAGRVRSGGGTRPCRRRARGRSACPRPRVRTTRAR